MSVINNNSFNFTLLAEKSVQVGINLTPQDEKKLSAFAALLLEWNEKMNLTAITEMDEVIVKHLVDSMTIIPFLKLEEERLKKPDLSIIDVGTGAGFPGIVIALLCPNYKVTLFDSLNKRLVFLNDVLDKLSISNASTCHGRAEEKGQTLDMREKFDVATARAVARLSVLSEFCTPFIKKQGSFIAMKGPDAMNELISAKKAFETLGLDYKGAKCEKLFLSLGDEVMERNIVTAVKKYKTPSIYPRLPALVKKSPL